MNTSGLRSIVLIALLFPLTVAAQNTPKIELFGGYSYLRLTKDSGLQAAGLNGWNAAAKLNVTPRIGVLADFSGDYGQRELAPYQLFLPIPGNPNPTIQTEPGHARQHTFVIGPEIRVLRRGRVTLSARTLVGVAKTNTLILPLTVPVQLPLGPNGESVTFSRRTISGGVAFAGSLGADLDYRITDRFSFRILQPELLLVNFVGATPVHARISTGIVFTSGKSASRDRSERHISFGVVGGGSVTRGFGQESVGFTVSENGGTQLFRSRFYSTRQDYIAGAMLELDLPWRLSLEADGLYRPLNFTYAIAQPNEPLHGGAPNTVVTWEFPVLAKYKFQAHSMRPFAEAGPSFRSSGNLNGTAPSSYGGTVGLGVEAPAWKLKIAPVLRYTHWAGEGLYQPHTKRNQVELLVVLSLRTR